MPSPKISVVMPVWNGERYLREAVESILSQTFTDFEFIVVDDGSTDATAQILAAYSDPRLRVFRLEHAGIVAALNFGIEKAQGAWVARQDADDASKPNRLEKQWNAVVKNPRAAVCFTDIELSGKTVPGQRPHFPKTKAFLALKLCIQNPITHSTVLFRKQAFLEAGGYRPEERHAEDFALWGRMIELGDFIGLAQKLLVFRLHSNSVSQLNLETQSALASRIATRHCQAFMRLTDEEAQRAQTILRTPPGERRRGDWWWFLRRCGLRLRWRSLEACGWLILQSAKECLRQVSPRRAA